MPRGVTDGFEGDPLDGALPLDEDPHVGAVEGDGVDRAPLYVRVEEGGPVVVEREPDGVPHELLARDRRVRGVEVVGVREVDRVDPDDPGERQETLVVCNRERTFRWVSRDEGKRKNWHEQNPFSTNLYSRQYRY